METRAIGRSNVTVSAVGLGTGPIGDAQLSEREVEELLHGALELGVTLFDTARSYGQSEERLGRYLRDRSEAVISTKVGYGVDGVADWTGECIRLGIDAALRRLHRATIDIVHLHSCPRSILERDDVVDALLRAREQGKIRCAAYSGDNEDIDFAIRLGVFDSVMTSLSICDQRSIDAVGPAVLEDKLGLIAKRPLANAPWLHAERPVGQECEEYWHRWQALGIPASELSWHELALRFALFSTGVSAVITGTRRLQHLRDGVSAAERGPLPAHRYAEIRERYWACGGFPGKI